jgi:hypothetical protein
MALEAILNRPDIHRIVLEENEDGVWVLVYAPNQSAPFRDICQDDWTMAKRDVFEDFGVTEDMFYEVPDARRMYGY